MKTYQFRIKDSTSRRKLNELASKVNFVWNFCRESQLWAKSRSRKYLSAFDLQKLTSGASKELGLNSVSIQATCERYSESSIQHRKLAKWRSYKKNLGWIPFKTNIKVNRDKLTFQGIQLRFWKSRNIQGKIKCGSFSCDAQGHWFVNITTDHISDVIAGDGEVGIDLGSKDLATLSNGIKYDNPKYYRKYEAKLSKLQKAKKKKQITKIHAKIKNSRNDYIHKITTEIANNNKFIVIGDIRSKRLAKTKMAKSVNDAGWFLFKTLLGYKAIERGSKCLVVNEKNTTRVCHACGCISDNSPKGISGLKIREWQCNDCGTIHDRDVNASRNILALGHKSLANKQNKAA